MTATFETKRLTRDFGGLRACADVSISLRAEDITALIGPNGAGKSTYFNMLGGALRPTSGSIHLNGRDITRLPPHRRALMGLGRTFQIAAVFRSMTVRENIQTALRAAGHAQDALDASLNEVNLEQDAERMIHELPYGSVKRLELAMALAGKPSVLLLDEPTAGMSGEERKSIMDVVIAAARRRNLILLFTEHDMDTVFSIATRVLVMSEGHIIADGTPDAVRQNAMVRTVYLGEDDA